MEDEEGEEEITTDGGGGGVGGGGGCAGGERDGDGPAMDIIPEEIIKSALMLLDGIVTTLVLVVAASLYRNLRISDLTA